MATPLSKAVVKNNVAMVRRLLELGCDPDITPKRVDLTALHVAIFEGRKDCLKVLLQGKADPNRRAAEVTTGDPAGKMETHLQCPPLHLALHTGNAHLVPFLMEHGADPEQRDGEGRTLEELAQQLGVNYRPSSISSSDQALPSKSRISLSNCTSAEGSGGATSAGGSSFLQWFITLMTAKMAAATIKKSKQ